MGKPKLVRIGLLNCFGCGLAGLQREGSDAVGAKRSSDAPDASNSANSSPALCQEEVSAAGSASGALESPCSGSRPSTAGSRARRPSTAFADPSEAGGGSLKVKAPPGEKLSNASAVAADDTAAPFSGPAAAAAAATATSLGGPSDASGFTTEVVHPRRHQPRKPRVRTSRVAPALDTEDELSPAVMSRSPSGSENGSPSPAYSTSFPPLEEEALRDGSAGADAGDAALLRRYTGSAVEGEAREAEDKAEGDGGCGDAADAAEAGNGGGPGPWTLEEPAIGSGGAVVPLFQKSASVPSSPSLRAAAAAAASAAAAAAAAAAAGGRGIRVHSRASSSASTAAAAAPTAVAAAAVRRNSVGGSVASSRNTSAATRPGAGPSRSSSAAAGPSAGAVGGAAVATVSVAAAVTSGGLMPEPDSPRLAFTRRGSSAGSRADAAVAAAASVMPGAPFDEDNVPGADGGSGGGAAPAIARRGSFAGDSSTSLVGPGNVSTAPQIRNCPSLRTTHGSPTPPPIMQPQLTEPPQRLGPCESLRLSPPSPSSQPPPVYQTCASLRLAPLSPPRLLTPSPSLRPTPLMPSPSLSRRPPPEDLLLLLPGAQSPEPEPTSPTPSAVCDHMLRLPPPQQPPLFQHSPCSFGRNAFPRANTLAPLPAENTAALNRLASMQVAFRERQQRQQQQQGGPEPAAAQQQPQDGVGGSTSGAAEGAGRMAPVELPMAASAERRAGTAAATSAGGGGEAGVDGGDDPYDSDAYSEYDDDVASMVSHLLPPSAFRSSAPAVPFGAMEIIKEHVRRAGSLEQTRPATADTAQCTAPLSEPAPAGVVSELPAESDQTSLGTHAAKWLEELLPPSPGYRSAIGTPVRAELGLPPSSSSSSSTAAAAAAVAARPGGAAGRKRSAALPAPDSFKCLMQEIE